jgi:hypothetical protein
MPNTISQWLITLYDIKTFSDRFTRIGIFIFSDHARRDYTLKGEPEILLVIRCGRREEHKRAIVFTKESNVLCSGTSTGKSIIPENKRKACIKHHT